MTQYEDRVWVLITRVLSGEATREEKEDFDRWLSEDPDHQSFYEEVKKDWEQEPENIEEVGSTPYLFDYESGLSRLEIKLEKEKDRGFNVPATVKSRRSAAWKIAASVLLVITALSAYVTSKHWNPPVTTYATTQIEQRIITLPDGSEVRLNKGSEISFTEGLSGSVRAVNLEGEAFFDVKRNPQRPFVIHVDDAEVRVLGTSFNVKELDGEKDRQILVAVKEGTVSLARQNSEKKNDAARITAGHLGMLASNGNKVEVEEANIENYLGWIKGYLEFDGMPFDRVVRQLERIYGIDCELSSPGLAELRLTVRTERLQKEEVLQSIATALNLAYRESEGKIIWSKK
ncbi:FecR domain-containing protein [Aliifodinibius sp. S!AR15-10]|uniref:FecR family protein n=1 Tax=Aliifodinibius sp. S!AR15-10 TaxID=2950437 RepID=UPI00285D3511|nr:FecR domain-containing protein [Aliifodinibius sp. S!AR15-10]MDR8391921.1 FecR domain-containing protein [Aliifodinibius sp. S!AR15-10]